jgi:hypothetical protein
VKNKLINLATIITTAAAGTSIYLATLPNPTDIQKQLSSNSIQIMMFGATAIFGLLDEEDKKDS